MVKRTPMHKKTAAYGRLGICCPVHIERNGMGNNTPMGFPELDHVWV
jgi:hypothetical protein